VLVLVDLAVSTVYVSLLWWTACLQSSLPPERPIAEIKITTKMLQTFDKVTVLYEGRQIFFGPAIDARGYFERLGFECPESQTTPDYLTSMTSPSERRIRPGYENTTPRTSDDFARCWKESPERQTLLHNIEQYDQAHPLHGKDHEQFARARTLEKSHKQREKSPYTLSYWGQIKLCMWREVQRIKNDPSVPLTMLFLNALEALIIASIFYNLPASTSSFFSRGGVLFMIVRTFPMNNISDTFLVSSHSVRMSWKKHKLL
jgi:ATP-binding cassette subfamily G (WHITE) protein 2 (PDR)